MDINEIKNRAFECAKSAPNRHLDNRGPNMRPLDLADNLAKDVRTANEQAISNGQKVDKQNPLQALSNAVKSFIEDKFKDGQTKEDVNEQSIDEDR